MSRHDYEATTSCSVKLGAKASFAAQFYWKAAVKRFNATSFFSVRINERSNLKRKAEHFCVSPAVIVWIIIKRAKRAFYWIVLFCKSLFWREDDNQNWSLVIIFRRVYKNCAHATSMNHTWITFLLWKHKKSFPFLKMHSNIFHE